MVADINQSLKKLHSLASELNKAADDATVLVRDIEKLLAQDLNLSVAAEVHAPSVVSQADEAYLSYTRVGGKFRIAVTHWEIRGAKTLDETWRSVSEIPWLECSRDVKLQSFPELPRLLEEIIKQAGLALESLSKATPAVKELLASH